MSDPEAKIDAALSKLEGDIAVVSRELKPLLNGSIDELSASKPDGPQKSAPYAVAAYALSSMLFAYLRSEGQDTSVVIPQLQAVKERMDAFASGESPKEPERAKPKPTPVVSAGKHTRFEETPAKKSKKKKKASKSEHA